MPATKTSNKLGSRYLFYSVDFDPDSADPVVVDLGRPQGAGEKGISLAVARLFRFKLRRTVGTGNIDAFQIIAATDAALTQNVTIVKAHATPTVANAVGDELYLECDAEMVHEVLATATHVGVRVEQATAGDECDIAVLAEPLYQYGELGADFIQ